MSHRDCAHFKQDLKRIQDLGGMGKGKVSKI